MCMCDEKLKIDDYTVKMSHGSRISAKSSQDLWPRIGKAIEVTKSIVNICKRKNITNNTKTYIGHNSV